MNSVNLLSGIIAFIVIVFLYSYNHLFYSTYYPVRQSSALYPLPFLTHTMLHILCVQTQSLIPRQLVLGLAFIFIVIIVWLSSSSSSSSRSWVCFCSSLGKGQRSRGVTLFYRAIRKWILVITNYWMIWTHIHTNMSLWKYIVRFAGITLCKCHKNAVQDELYCNRLHFQIVFPFPCVRPFYALRINKCIWWNRNYSEILRMLLISPIWTRVKPNFCIHRTILCQIKRFL